MLLSQRRLRWLGHVRRMADGRIPKDLLYGELSRGARSRGRPRLRFKDTCKRDLKSASIDIQSWESLAESRDSWRAAVHCGTKQAEQDRTDHLKEKRAARKRSCSIDQAATFHTCRLCGKDCHSRIGLHSHTRRCSDQNWLNLMQQSSPETEGGRRRRMITIISITKIITMIMIILITIVILDIYSIQTFSHCSNNNNNNNNNNNDNSNIIVIFIVTIIIIIIMIIIIIIIIISTLFNLIKPISWLKESSGINLCQAVYLTIIPRARVVHELIANEARSDKSEWNNCFIIYKSLINLFNSPIIYSGKLQNNRLRSQPSCFSSRNKHRS